MWHKSGSSDSRCSLAGPDAGMRWFGKLPTYGDYYSSPADHDWCIELHDWIMKGYVAYRAHAGASAGGRMPPTASVIRLPESGVTVLASLDDFGGDARGRSFPLCFYVALPSAAWPGPTCDTVSGGLAVLDQLATVHTDVRALIDAGGPVESVFTRREIDLSPITDGATDESWTESAAACPLAEWFAGARPLLRTDDMAGWFDAADRWGRTISGLEAATFEATLRFPLSTAAPIPVQAAGWLHWLGARMDLHRRRLTLAISTDPPRRSGHLVVAARRLLAEDFFLTTPAGASLPYVDDLSRVAPPAEPPAPDNVPPTGSWLDFVQGR